MFLWIALTSLAVMLVSLSGVILVWTGFGSWVEDNLATLTSFAAGVFFVVTIQLIRHAFYSSQSIWWPLMWILIGAATVYVIILLVPAFHHHDHCDNCKHNFSPSGILFGDALHNIGDGLLLAAGFQVSITAGIAAGVAIFIHEIIQEVSEFFVLKTSGFSTATALAYNFAVSSTILLGATGGYLAATQAAILRTPLLAVAAGSFLVVVVHDLLPHSAHHTDTWRDAGTHLLWFILGIALMGVALFAAHG